MKIVNKYGDAYLHLDTYRDVRWLFNTLKWNLDNVLHHKYFNAASKHSICFSIVFICYIDLFVSVADQKLAGRWSQTLVCCGGSFLLGVWLSVQG